MIPTKTISTPILAAAAALLLATSARAALINVNPAIDAFVSANHSTSNYGGAGALAVSGSGTSKGEFDSLMQFNLSAAKASLDSTFGAGLWAIDGMSLQLTFTSPNNAIFNTSAAGQVAVKWMQNDSWTEGTGTPNAPGATGIKYSTLSSFLNVADQALGSFAFGGGTSGNATWSLGLASSFVSDATAGNLVSLLMLPGDTSVAMLDYSRTGATQPVLTVSAHAVPEPGTFAFGIGMLCVSLAARRRQGAGRA